VKKQAEYVIANLLCVRQTILGKGNRRCHHLGNGGAQFTNVEINDATGVVKILYPPLSSLVRTTDSYSLELVKDNCKTVFIELPAADLFESPKAGGPLIRLLQMEPICASSTSLAVDGAVLSFSVEVFSQTGGLNLGCYDETGRMVVLTSIELLDGFKSYPRFAAVDSKAGYVCRRLLSDRRKLLYTVGGGKVSFLKKLEIAQQIGKLPIGFRPDLFDGKSSKLIKEDGTTGVVENSISLEPREPDFSQDGSTLIRPKDRPNGDPFCSMKLSSSVAGTFYAFGDEKKLDMILYKFEKLFGHLSICAISKGSFGTTHFIDGRSFERIEQTGMENEILVLEKMLGIVIRIQFEYLQNERVDRKAPLWKGSPKPDADQMVNLFFRLWVAVFEAEQFNIEKKLDIFSILPNGEDFANLEATMKDKCTEQFIGIQVADFKDGDALERIAANAGNADSWICGDSEKNVHVAIPEFSSSGFCSSHRSFLICEFHGRVRAYRHHQSTLSGCQVHLENFREKACASLFRNFVRIQTAADTPKRDVNENQRPILSFISKILPSVSGLFSIHKKPASSEVPAPQTFVESVFEIFQSVGELHDFHLDPDLFSERALVGGKKKKKAEMKFDYFYTEVDAPTEFHRKDQTCSESFASTEEGFKKFFKLSPGLDGAHEYATAVSRTRAAPCVSPSEIGEMINAIKESGSVQIVAATISCEHDQFVVSCRIKKNGGNPIESTRNGTIHSGKSHLCNEHPNSDALKNECFASYFLSDALHRELSAVRPRSRSELETDDHWVPIQSVGTTDVGSAGIHLSKKVSSTNDLIGVMASETKKGINEPKCIVRFESEHESKPLTINLEIFLRIINDNFCETTLGAITTGAKRLPKLAEPTYGRKRSQDKFEISCFYLHGTTELKLTRDLVRASHPDTKNHPFCMAAGEGGCDFSGKKAPDNLDKICDGLLRIYLLVEESPLNS
jgi:hypothetical protein